MANLVPPGWELGSLAYKDLLLLMQTYWTEFQADAQEFYQAVNWSQPWLRAWAVFYGGLVVATVYYRGDEGRLAALFITLSIMVLGAQPLNTLAAGYWSDFSDANYFQEHGHFISLVYSIPLLLLLLTVLVMLIFHAGSRLIQVKRQQIRQATKTKTTSKKKSQ
ncbi:hypothetical protein H4R33_001368 [Dimargaris cristalligena]|uniref:Transmembrane protein 18-domain-containing protein n=1 Tax=Dimargaris cristalligena TaxID=215637 RepID=A0A4P9ZYP2_9FUNG|nr:hypothetical protein H4R33_001368 [Dimargaris cristalligena]RKP38875.1 transmembrane protein 18-domain-containing protein [Dimargaris cristalligena]|eukprot:RKP38875.1 transmembrane protein 18-domain-containing protein [Dimargaris cristalligena]